MTDGMVNYDSLKSKYFKDSLLIFIGGLILFTLGLHPEFIGPQTRFALFAKEMLHYGPTFFPTTYRMPYPDYPSMSTFLIYLLSFPLGGITVFTAVLPTAITSALILVFIYRIGALQSRRWGILAVLFTLFTFEFLHESRSIALDQYTSLAGVLCFYVAYSATALSRYRRLWWIPFIFIMGFSFRGPIGLVIPAAITCGFYFWERQYRKCLMFSLTALLLLGCCLAVLWAAAYQQGGEVLGRKVLQAQGFGRIERYSHNYFYYVGKGFTAYAVSFPLAVLVSIAYLKKIIKRENANYKLLGHLALWSLIIFLGMSVPGTKKTRYLLPVVPALALLASYGFVQPVWEDSFARIKTVFLKGCIILPFVAGIATVIVCVPNKFFTPLSPLYGFMVLIPLICLMVFYLRSLQKTKKSALTPVTIITLSVLAFLIFNLGIIEPYVYYRERTRPFIEKVESEVQKQPGLIAFYKIGPDAEDIKFTANCKNSFIPEFVNNPEDLLHSLPTTYFIARGNVFDGLPEEIKQKISFRSYGNIGHKQFVVFSAIRVK